MTLSRSLTYLILLPFLAGIAFAEAPTTSPRPMPRPGAVGRSAEIMVSTSLRPQPRPSDFFAPTDPVLVSAPAANGDKPAASRKGSVCQNSAIKGLAVKPILSRTKGCSVKDPVLVSSVDGVRLNPPATLNCNAANALAEWVDEGLQPAFNNQVVQLNIADSYSCRPRNNVRGNKVSEHGSGNAIDISAFVLRSGKVMSVSGNYGTQIKRAKQAACGTFHTTLGPGSDGYHENHIHLDVAQNRGGSYCH